VKSDLLSAPGIIYNYVAVNASRVEDSDSDTFCNLSLLTSTTVVLTMRAVLSHLRVRQPSLAARFFFASPPRIGTTRVAERQKSTLSLSNPLFNPDKGSHQDRFTFRREAIVAYPKSPTRPVPLHIRRPPYADTGVVPFLPDHDKILLHNKQDIRRMRSAAQLAATVLHHACALAMYPGTTTDEIDEAVHTLIISAGAYPSPLNYAGFPKSVCSSINEVVCHGIPDTRPLQYGDVVSFDVSCYLNGVHGDNCATIIVGDYNDDLDGEAAVAASSVASDWRGVPFRTRFETSACEAHFVEARRLVQATRHALLAAVATVRPGSRLNEIGAACQDVADRHGYSSVTKYKGHGIGEAFHTAPFVMHYRNSDKTVLRPGMIFTIEPMLCQFGAATEEWDDDWTVYTTDGGLSAQFEHTVLVTETGVEILTLPSDDIKFDL
jgi:methionyl aminopeptidase